MKKFRRRGVEKQQQLPKKTATVNLESDVSGQLLMDAVNEAGFEAVSVKEKKGLFGNS